MTEHLRVFLNGYLSAYNMDEGDERDAALAAFDAENLSQARAAVEQLEADQLEEADLARVAAFQDCFDLADADAEGEGDNADEVEGEAEGETTDPVEELEEDIFDVAGEESASADQAEETEPAAEELEVAGETAVAVVEDPANVDSDDLFGGGNVDGSDVDASQLEAGEEAAEVATEPEAPAEPAIVDEAAPEVALDVDAGAAERLAAIARRREERRRQAEDARRREAARQRVDRGREARPDTDGRRAPAQRRAVRQPTPDRGTADRSSSKSSFDARPWVAAAVLLAMLIGGALLWQSNSGGDAKPSASSGDLTSESLATEIGKAVNPLVEARKADEAAAGRLNVYMEDVDEEFPIPFAKDEEGRPIVPVVRKANDGVNCDVHPGHAQCRTSTNRQLDAMFGQL